jgi:hypothetical protein
VLYRLECIAGEYAKMPRSDDKRLYIYPRCGCHFMLCWWLEFWDDWNRKQQSNRHINQSVSGSMVTPILPIPVIIFEWLSVRMVEHDSSTVKNYEQEIKKVIPS